jgi:hypothetical protein
MLSLAAIANSYLWVEGEGHFTSDLTSSGSVKMTNGLYITGSPACIYLDGKAKSCVLRSTLTSTGGTAIPTSPAIFRLQHTSANFGFTGSAAILRFVIRAQTPGEALTISCGTTTGTTLLNSVRTNLLPTHPGGVANILDTGATLQSQVASGYVLLGRNRYVQCTNSTTHEAAAGLAGEVTMEYMQID